MNKAILAGLVLVSACTGKTEHTGAEAKKPQAREGVVIAPNGLVLREGPSSRSTRQLLIPYGKTVTILSNSKITNQIDGLTAPWLYCSFGTQAGWVFGGFVRYQTAGSRGPRGLAIDRVPTVLYALFGKNPAQAIRRFGQPVSLRQSAIESAGMTVLQQELVWPGMRIGFSQALELETIHLAVVDNSAPATVRQGLDIGEPVSVLSNLIHPTQTSIRSNLVSRSFERMQVTYTLSHGRITGFSWQNIW